MWPWKKVYNQFSCIPVAFDWRKVEHKHRTSVHSEVGGEQRGELWFIFLSIVPPKSTLGAVLTSLLGMNDSFIVEDSTATVKMKNSNKSSVHW